MGRFYTPENSVNAWQNRGMMELRLSIMPCLHGVGGLLESGLGVVARSKNAPCISSTTGGPASANEGIIAKRDAQKVSLSIPASIANVLSSLTKRSHLSTF